MALKIIGISASRALRPLWAALELDLAFEHAPQTYLNGATRSPEILALNPNGHIPIVIDEGQDQGRDVVVWESMACVLYLARRHGKPDGVSIAPANAREEADALRWAFWAVTSLEKDALTVLMHRLGMPEPERKPELAAAAEQRLRQPLAVLEGHLERQAQAGCDYLSVERFTVADLCVASVALWIKPAHELLKAHSRVAHWLQLCTARPAHHRARQLGKA